MEKLIEKYWQLQFQCKCSLYRKRLIATTTNSLSTIKWANLGHRSTFSTVLFTYLVGKRCQQTTANNFM